MGQPKRSKAALQIRDSVTGALSSGKAININGRVLYAINKRRGMFCLLLINTIKRRSRHFHTPFYIVIIQKNKVTF